VRRFFVPAGALGGRQVVLPPELARRLATVLRLKRGDRILLADGSGRDYEVELTAVSARAASAAVVGERASPPEPSVELTLYQSLIRPQRFELALEKGTEVGVSRFVPLMSGRARLRTEGSPQRLERWRRIIREAAEQASRGRLPAVEPPVAFEEAVRSAAGLKLIPWESERERGLAPYLRGLKERPRVVSLFIGPEGGLAEAEVEAARAVGCVTVSLGPRVLRSETAGIVAAALVMSELGEMGS
jgi:16S rRNA (uracil1498-N3)-methyltransferase